MEKIIEYRRKHPKCKWCKYCKAIVPSNLPVPSFDKCLLKEIIIRRNWMANFCKYYECKYDELKYNNLKNLKKNDII